ncbi:MAG: chromosome segregation protein SMC [Kordiimonadaceae bacterium]|nr:chromosome segregation protein SMC [Kordiimonadaceae bacterium]MBO6567148.1 chromosome segregation protein SMC [Kordiimonadaceae bacterium]MBO6963637.1 chromosome segregation protein SMC [Kordiimonadaceae bacterium]
MRFSRLRLSGFKSFVDPTELLIEPGLTGVVGPNGCGKSNLLEAIRWVMGENRAKSLRGSGMDDVIFAGTDRRPARNMAEVTLVIDNSDRAAPAEYNDQDLIEVTRRIERESGSAYRINGNDVRQKDVQLLFADAATGAHSPALVSQGRIGSLINAKPQDRRAILEEAAGISGLHTRRKEAESRLRSAENNLVRVHDVIQAMESQINSLKRQARQAVRYRAVSGDIRQAEASLMYLRWNQASEEVIELERKLRQAEIGVGEIEGQVASISKEQAEVAAALPPLRDRDVEAAAALQRLSIARENLEAEAERRKQTAISLRATLEQITGDRAREQEINDDATAALDRLNTEKARLESARDAEKSNEVEAKEALEAAVQAAGEAEAEFDQVSEQAAGARAQRSSLESDRLAINRRAEQLGAEAVRLEGELAALVDSDESLSSLKAAEEAVASEEKRLEQAGTSLVAAEKATQEARARRQDSESTRAELAAQLKALAAECESIRRMLDTGASDEGKPVSDDLTADAGFEKAVGAALGDAAEAGTDTEATRFWQTVGEAPAFKWPDGVVALSDHVKAPDELSRLFAATGVVDDEAAAPLVSSLSAGQQLVSKDGSLWRWDGYASRSDAPTAAAIRLEQKNRLKDLEKDLAALEKRVEDASHAAEAAADAHTSAREAENAQRQVRQDAEKALADARRAFVAAEQEASSRANKVNLLKETLERVSTENTETTKRLEDIDQRIGALPDTAELEKSMAKVRENVDTLRADLSSKRSAYDSLRREAEGRTDRLNAINTESGAWQLRVSSARKQLVSLDERETAAKEQLEAVEAGPDDLVRQREALLEQLGAAETARKETSDALMTAENALREKDQALRDIQEAQAAARERQIRADAAVENAVSRRKDLAAQIGERFECAPTQLLEKVELETSDNLPDVSVLETKLEKLKRERDNMGAVNLRADEELNEIDEQMTHLVSERTDLEEAIARLRQAIGSLNREGRERLLAAFDIVNNHFGELFKSLFGGGEAHLKLTESEDPLDAGLEIFASPPGKRLQALSLLSGGEQALTALSLIFAVFITNPAPICVLDEVDAPLDDANVERFCNLLDEMMERTDTRFLIVTHNAVSMARMKRLFGVTMAERGISTLVSVDLERAEELRDAS